MEFGRASVACVKSQAIELSLRHALMGLVRSLMSGISKISGPQRLYSLQDESELSGHRATNRGWWPFLLALPHHDEENQALPPINCG